MHEKDLTGIHDESSDRKFFTILPNYIADHCGMEAQSLYFIMKRYAGEHGSCYASERTLRKKMKAGRIAMKRGLNELIELELIRYKGMQMVDTDSGEQWVKGYTIVDIWQENMNHYRPAENGRPAENDTLGLLKTAPKKNHLLRRTNNNTRMNKIELRKLMKESGECVNPKQDVEAVIGAFAKVNPDIFRTWYKIKAQRLACDRLIDAHGLETAVGVAKALASSNQMDFFPRIYTPVQLEQKWQSLHDAYRSAERKRSKNAPIVLFS